MNLKLAFPKKTLSLRESYICNVNYIKLLVVHNG